jgi:hypothetical protein
MISIRKYKKILIKGTARKYDFFLRNAITNDTPVMEINSINTNIIEPLPVSVTKLVQKI